MTPSVSQIKIQDLDRILVKSYPINPKYKIVSVILSLARTIDKQVLLSTSTNLISEVVYFWLLICSIWERK
jgi:hypothetical protein